MKENAYGGIMKDKLVKEAGGQIYKISDQATLGLPDYGHIQGGFTTYIECKIGTMFETGPFGFRVYPRRSVNDIRQFEVCRRIGKEALVLYAIYYPKIKMTCVMTVEMMATYDKEEPLIEGHQFRKGHGIEMIVAEERTYQWRMPHAGAGSRPPIPAQNI